MNELANVLKDLSQNRISLKEAEAALKKMLFWRIPGAKLDFSRTERVGVPEVILAQHKSPAQLRGIVGAHVGAKRNCLLTRVKPNILKKLQKEFPALHTSRRARMAWWRWEIPPPKPGRITVVSAGSSDLPVALEAVLSAKFLSCRVSLIEDCGVAGIQRILSQADHLMQANCIITVAGMEGALPSVVSGLTGKPVIAVPTSKGYGVSAKGWAALLGMLSSCSPTVSVVNIDNGFGAACVADAILRQGAP